MARHETEQLWAFAGGELAPAEAARVEAHLEECLSCELKLDEVKAARALLSRPPVAALAPAQWSRIDHQVAAAAKRVLEPPRWRSFLSRPPAFAVGALALAAVALFVLWPSPAPAPPPVARVEPAPPSSGPLPPANPGQVGEGVVRVAFVRGAASAVRPPDGLQAGGPGRRSALAANAPLASGSSVSTGKKSELWLALPDGSRAGVLGNSRLTLARIEPAAVRLTLEKGSVVVEASHLEGREFHLNAGEVEVRVVGTRFLVERIDDRVLIAVSEGAVQVAAGERLYTVAAGHKLIVGKGKPVEARLGASDDDGQALRSPPPRAALPTQQPEKLAEPPDEGWAPYRAAPQESSAAPAPPIPAEAPSPNPETEFAAYPGPSTSPGPPPKAVKLEEPQDGGEPTVIEKLLAADIDSPFPPLGISMAEHRARQIQKVADNNQCRKVLPRVEAWLDAYPEDGEPERSALRRQVLFTKARCLVKVGRPEEAEAVRQLLP